MPRPKQDFLTFARAVTLQQQGYNLIAYRRLDDHCHLDMDNLHYFCNEDAMAQFASQTCNRGYCYARI